MYTPQTLEAFFSRYLPSMKQIIEDHWHYNREELIAFLTECMTMSVEGTWMDPYFKELLRHAKTAPHDYTDPWKSL